MPSGGLDMKILVACDSFKGSLDTLTAANCIKTGFQRVFPQAEYALFPIADGGEGTATAAVTAVGGRFVARTVTGPLGESVNARFAVLDNGWAVVEMAEASGLPLVPKGKRDPAMTTTYGTGELLRAALDEGCRSILVGIGGSATNDGGAGMAQALGARLLDEEGRELPNGGGALSRLARIDRSGLDPRLAQCGIEVVCDVTNPLCGPEGASAVFGPQKGASPEQVERLDRALEGYGRLLEEMSGQPIMNLPGAGAAGGLGAGLVAFCGGVLRSGVEAMLSMTGVERAMADADLVITGEGRIDSTTARGKVTSGVAKLARRFGVPVLAVCGGLSGPQRAVWELGVDGLMCLPNAPMTLDRSMAQAGPLLTDAAERMARLLQVGGRLSQ